MVFSIVYWQSPYLWKRPNMHRRSVVQTVQARLDGGWISNHANLGAFGFRGAKILSLKQVLIFGMHIVGDHHVTLRVQVPSKSYTYPKPILSSFEPPKPQAGWQVYQGFFMQLPRTARGLSSTEELQSYNPILTQCLKHLRLIVNSPTPKQNKHAPITYIYM